MVSKNLIQNDIKKNICIYLLGQLVSMFGSSLYVFATSFYILSITGSALNFGISFALGTLPKILVSPFAGIVVDKYSKKCIIVGCDLVCCVLLLGMVVVNYNRDIKLLSIYVSIAILAIINALFNTAMISSIPELVNEDSLEKMNSLSGLITSISSIIGIFLGGSLFAFIHIKLFIVINALSFGFSGVSEIFLSYQVGKKQKYEKNSLFENLKQGIVYVIKKEWILSLLIFTLLFNSVMVIGLNLGLPIIIVNVIKASSLALAMVNVSFPIGTLCSSFLYMFGKIKIKEKDMFNLILIMGLLIAFIGIIMGQKALNLSLMSNIIILSIINYILGFLETIVNVTIMVKIQKEVSTDMLGRVQGLLNMLVLGFVPLASILGGKIFEATYPPYVVIACGVLMSLLVVAKNWITTSTLKSENA